MNRKKKTTMSVEEYRCARRAIELDGIEHRVFLHTDGLELKWARFSCINPASVKIETNMEPDALRAVLQNAVEVLGLRD